jgi:hypothetical protein
MTLPVRHLFDFVLRPMEVVSDIGYLLGQLIQGVASYPSGIRPPLTVDSSNSKSLSHSGQVIFTRE